MRPIRPCLLGICSPILALALAAGAIVFARLSAASAMPEVTPARVTIPQALPAAPSALPVVVFVGNTQVDLLWFRDPLDLSYKIKKDGVEWRQVLDPNNTFLRDSDVVKGSTHTYQVIRVLAGGVETPYGDPETAVAGQVHGTLYQSLVWASGVYTLTGEVGVGSGVRLDITQGAEVYSNRGFITGYGQKSITGATIALGTDSRIELGPGSLVQKSTLKASLINVWGDATFLENTLTGEIHLNGGQVRFEHNTFYAVFLKIWQDAQVTLRFNRTEENPRCCSDWYTLRLYIEGQAGADIQDNDLGGEIEISSPTAVNIQRNYFHPFKHSWGSTYITVDGVENPGVIEDNIFQGQYDMEVGIVFEPGSSMLVRNNLFVNLSSALSIRNASPQIQGNQMTGIDSTVIGVSGGRARINNNCIAGNILESMEAALAATGLTQTLDAANNWWGDPSGPAHPDNPGGLGERIIGENIKFKPWLDSIAQQSCKTNDLRLVGMEVVQAVQTRFNEVPLVSGKETLVRVYPQSGLGAVAARVVVRLYRNSIEVGRAEDTFNIPEIQALNSQRANMRRSFNNFLPARQLTGTLTLVAEVNPERSIPEITYKNNIFTVTVSFKPRDPMRIAYVPIQYEPTGMSYSSLPDVTTLPTYTDILKKVYPLPSASYIIWPHLQWHDWMKGSDFYLKSHMLLTQLTHQFFQAWWNPDASRRVHQVFGVFHPGELNYCMSDPRWITNLSTHAAGYGRAAFCDEGGFYVAHEIGHNLGLRHPATADSCNSQDPNTDWPFTVSTIGEFGYFQTAPGLFAVSNTNKDFMSYCFSERMWVSPYHYNKLFNGKWSPSLKPPETSTSYSYLAVSGVVYKNNQVEFLPVWSLAASGLPDEMPDGTAYCLELRDAADAVLESQCFDLAFTYYDTGEPMTLDSFLILLPEHAGGERLVLRKGASILGQVSASPHAPTVKLLAPDGGETLGDHATVTWSASDQDGDPLAFNLYYSSDNGASWLPLALDLTTVSSTEVNLSLAAGSQAARLRIDASDGFNTASDLSDAPFRVSNKRPLVSILDPQDGEVISSTLGLFGAAYDVQDGPLSGASLTWSSSLDGALGSGEQVSQASLSPGLHQLTLTAVNAFNLSSQAVVSITVPSQSSTLTLFLPVMRK